MNYITNISRKKLPLRLFELLHELLEPYFIWHTDGAKKNNPGVILYSSIKNIIM
jgi:hypothetical protein